MGNKQNLEPEGFRMFRNNKSQKDIASALGVTEATVSAWKKKFDWDRRKYEWQNSRQATAEKYLEMIAKEAQAMEKLESGMTDKHLKALKIIKELDAQSDILASTIQIMEDLLEFLQAKGHPAFTDFQELLPDFLMYQRQKADK